MQIEYDTIRNVSVKNALYNYIWAHLKSFINLDHLQETMSYKSNSMKTGIN